MRDTCRRGYASHYLYRKRLDAYDLHFFPAPTIGQFGTTRLQQTLNHRHWSNTLTGEARQLPADDLSILYLNQICATQKGLLCNAQCSGDLERCSSTRCPLWV